MDFKTISRLSASVLFALGLAARLPAQQFGVQHYFTNSPDGANPGALVLAAGAFYGATANGGTSNYGMAFKLGSDGTGFAPLNNFPGDTNGGSPNDLLVNGGALYGTASVGGNSSSGTVFSMSTNGTGYAVLRSFTNSPDGATPHASLVLNGTMLYGTTAYGGIYGNGTVFALNTNGTGYTVLHSFTNTPDGATPRAGLVLNGTTLYGTTASGGIFTNGTVFKLNTNGTGYAVIYNFSNSPDAQGPYATMVFSSNMLYGTASYGGSNNSGAVFKLGTNGAGYSVLHSFTGPTSPTTNSDGSSPQAGLLLSGALLYGTTISGGSGSSGTLFQINTNGTGFLVIKSFTNAPDGANPQSGLLLNSNTLWGTAHSGGKNNNGTVFSVLLSPVITLQPQSVSVTNGHPAAFSVTATDNSAISYQWYFNTNTLLAGQTNNTLNFASATNNNAGTYTVVVADNFGSVTSSPAVLTVVAYPIISAQPQNLTVTNGLAASFAVTVTGQTPLYCQWYFNSNTGNPGLLGNALAGQTATNLTFTSTNNSGGYYSVVITNVAGAVTSSPALLTVIIVAPSLTAQPQSQTVTNGFAASFAVTANGQTPLYYQWYFNTNALLVGQTNSTLSFFTTTNNGGYYSVVVSNIFGSATSSPALLTIVLSTNAPVITQPPQPLMVISGGTANFSVTASGKNPLRYQWYFNTNSANTNLLGNGLANQTNTTLTFTTVTNSGGYYSVVVSNRIAVVTSTPPVLLTIITKPVITLQPQSVTVTNGNPATFTAAAIGAGRLNYQWYFQTNTLLAGATNTTLNLTNAGAGLAGAYLMIVSNAYGQATSSVASLTVVGTTNQPPKILNFGINPASGSFSLTATNSANSVNRLWATTNLAATNFWQVIATNVMAANGLWFFTDTNIAKTNNVRFYRFSTP